MNKELQKIKHERARKGVDKYSRMIYQVAYGYLKIESDAQDVVQEVLLKYIQNDKQFFDESHERNWIIRVAINYSCNIKKSAWKRYTVPLNENVKLETEIEYELFDCLDMLEDKYRIVIQLFYLQDLPIKEISKVLNISEDNVKTRLKRGRDKIKEIIKQGEFFDV